MSTTVHKAIRIYDLAKELKLDNKKVIEDARREGVEVSVPSNTVSHEVAERIRLKYFPKKVAPKAGPRLVKHVKAVEPVEAPSEEVTLEAAHEPAIEEVAAAPESLTPEPPRPRVRVLKAPPPRPAVTPGQVSESTEPEQAPPLAAAEPGADSALPPSTIPATQRPPTSVRVLRPIPGAPSPPPPARVAGGYPSA